MLLIGYAILDGFDLGVGFLSLFAKSAEDRHMMMRAIWPVWDGNEVWLLTGGGALFAAFPKVYATAFSAMYPALMIVLFSLIFRAVAIEFRNQLDSPGWRRFWDLAFGMGSTLPALLFGVALGNVMRGLAIDPQGNFTGSFFSLLNPYALLVGLLSLSMLATHAALYLGLKTEGPLHEQAVNFAETAWGAFIILFLVCSVFTMAVYDHLLASYSTMPILALNPAAAFICIMTIWVLLKKRDIDGAFIASSFSIVFILVTAGVSLFPELIPAPNHPENGLTIYNASSSDKTLTAMLIVAGIGMPLVIAYTIFAYRTFRGKVGEEEGY